MSGSFSGRERWIFLREKFFHTYVFKYFNVTKEHDVFTKSNKFCVVLSLRCGKGRIQQCKNLKRSGRKEPDLKQLSCHVISRIKSLNTFRNTGQLDNYVISVQGVLKVRDTRPRNSIQKPNALVWSLLISLVTIIDTHMEMVNRAGFEKYFKNELYRIL